MTTFYVNKSGSDSNDGLTPATAKLSIQGASDAAANNDTIIVQDGVYSETVVGTKTSQIFKADGFAILDGENVLTTAFSNCFEDLFTGFIFKNFTSFGSGANRGTYTDCWFEDCPIGIHDAGGTSSSFTFTRCVFVGCTTAGLDIPRRSGAIRSCTFVDCGKGLFIENNIDGGDFKVTVQNCIFRSNTTHIDVADDQTWGTLCNGNDIDFSSGNCIIEGVMKTTLADWQSASNGDIDSISADPKFRDEAKRLFVLAEDSLCLISGLLSVADRVQGAFNRKLVGGDAAGEAISINKNPMIWNDPSGTPPGTAVYSGVEQDVNGELQLTSSATTGTAIFTMIFDPAIKIGRIFIDPSLFYPLGVIDSDNTDSAPNRLTIEAAIDTGSGLGAYSTFKPGPLDQSTPDDISPSVAVEAMKIRVTLRRDGVSA